MGTLGRKIPQPLYDTYAKSEVEALDTVVQTDVDTKAPQATTYTKTEVDADLEIKVPTASIMTFTVGTTPTGFLECDGSALDRTVYANLFSIIGETYGVGDGSTTFNIPDLRGEFIRGFDNGRGVDIGRSVGTSQADAIRNITGSFRTKSDDGASGAFAKQTSHAYVGTQAGNGTDYTDFDVSRVVPTAADNRPRNIAMMFCIKY